MKIVAGAKHKKDLTEELSDVSNEWKIAFLPQPVS